MVRLIEETDPDVFEKWKWNGVPVWPHDVITWSGESCKDVATLTFAEHAPLS